MWTKSLPATDFWLFSYDLMSGSSVYVWHASVDILSGQLVAAQDPDFSINSLGVKKSYVNPSQLLSLGGVWRLSTLPAGHDVYVLPYAIKWCGLSIVNCFRR